MATENLGLRTQDSLPRGGGMGKIACCHNCVFSYWDREQAVQCMGRGIMSWPACANHPESYGRMQRVPGRGMCENYRARPGTPVGDVRQIPLGDGFYAYVDAADYEWLSGWTWQLRGGYAARMEKRKPIYMHRAIMQTPQGMVVDHKNRNKLDNTRGNLWNCTAQENACNRGKKRGTASRFRGVGFNKDYGKHFADIYFKGKRYFLGYFPNETEAARARDRKAVELLGDTARVNFPDEWPAERRAQVYARRDIGGRASRRVRGRERTSRVTRAGVEAGSQVHSAPVEGSGCCPGYSHRQAAPVRPGLGAGFAAATRREDRR